MINQELPVLQLPNFDIDEFEQASSQERARVLDKLRECCHEHGFFTISGHGVSKSLMQDALNMTRKFFSQPIEMKRACTQSSVPKFQMKERGYTEREFYSNNPILDDAPLDLNEGFIVSRNLTREQVDHLNDVIKKEYYSDNIWPSELPEMRSIMTSYYEEIALLTLRVREFLKSAFDFEVPACEYATSLMRMNYYPRIIEEVPANQWRISEHADFCMFTILLTEAQDPEITKINRDLRGGLEVFRKEKGWYRTSYDHSSFVVNCGDTLEMLSDGKCKSSFHRVGIPSVSKAYDNSRASIAYFCAADYTVDKKTAELYQKLINVGNTSAM